MGDNSSQSVNSPQHITRTETRHFAATMLHRVPRRETAERREALRWSRKLVEIMRVAPYDSRRCTFSVS